MSACKVLLLIWSMKKFVMILNDKMALKWNLIHILYQTFKVEFFLKGSLDWIPSPSPSVKIQVMGGKVCLRCKGKTLLLFSKVCWHHPAMFCLITSSKLANKKFVDNAQQCYAFTPQANFSTHNLNFHWNWRWWNWIGYLLKSSLL